MSGLGDRVATEALSALLRHALRFYFPALWPEAEQDELLLQAERGAVAVSVPTGATRRTKMR